MVKTAATPRPFPGWDKVDADLKPIIDNLYDLGSEQKRWAAAFIVLLAVATSITIGGVVKLSTQEGMLFVNASTYMNESLWVRQNITGVNISATGYFFGNGSQLTDITLTETDPYWTGNKTNVAFTNVNEVFTQSVNISGNLTLETANYCIIFQSGGKICSGV